MKKLSGPENLKRGLSLLSDKLLAKLSKKDYRDLYMDQTVRSWLARQVRVLREDRGWSQQDLAEATGLKQSAVSRLEDPDYGRYTLSTLLKLRSAFDVGLEVKFVEYGAAIAHSRDVSRSALKVCSYHAEQMRPQVTLSSIAIADVHIEYEARTRVRMGAHEKISAFWDYRPKEVV